MPGGMSNPTMGVVAFGIVKFIGYSLATIPLNNTFNSSLRTIKNLIVNLLIFGITRTILGLSFGFAYGKLIEYLMDHGFAVILSNYGLLLRYAGLFPVRLIEWGLVVWLFYDRNLAFKKKILIAILLGSIYSYILDIPAVGGLIAASGFYIC